MNKLNFEKLIKEYQEGLLSDRLNAVLDEWFLALGHDIYVTEWNEEEKNKLKEKILLEISREKEKNTKEIIGKQPSIKSPITHTSIKVKRIWSKATAIAASVTILIAVGTWLFLEQQKKSIVSVQPLHDNQEEFAQVKNKATLQLAHGNTVVLDDLQTGKRLNEGETEILIQDEKQIKYIASNAKRQKVVFNTLSTSRGGQYKLILPDGSKVWLNAASSIRFPNIFIGEERIVEITGEVYFEIAKAYNATSGKSIPFKVNVNNVEIDVLGTHFNVMAYKDEVNIQATLLEGIVKITKGKTSRMLKPGQQAVMNVKQDNIIKIVDDVNLSEAIAWKNGFFSFNNADIETVMRELARWYDIEVVFNGAIPELKFSGELQRDLTLIQILNILDKSHIKFKLKANKIIYIPE